MQRGGEEEAQGVTPRKAGSSPEGTPSDAANGRGPVAADLSGGARAAAGGKPEEEEPGEAPAPAAEPGSPGQTGSPSPADSSVRFASLAYMCEHMSRTSRAALKRKHLHTFLDDIYGKASPPGASFFGALRLMLPELDRERDNYGLREASLAKCLIEALGISRDAEDAKRLENWRKATGARHSRYSKTTGKFALVAAEVLQPRQMQTSGELTIAEVNALLDRLALAQAKEGKVEVLRELIRKTNTREMKWLLMIILKDMRMGSSEKTVLKAFHPDAESLFNVTCDLQGVCQKLADRTKRMASPQKITPGFAVRPQLANRASSVEDIWKKLGGKRLVAERKFDGDRIQVHRNGNNLNYFSRTFVDHQEYDAALAELLLSNLKHEKCILDGELMVWDRSEGQFVEFGLIPAAAKQARDGEDSHLQLCYIAFDVLLLGERGSVIHLPLEQRLALLATAFTPVPRRLELLQPQEIGEDQLLLGSQSQSQSQLPSNLQGAAGADPLWSAFPCSLDQLKHFFQSTVDNREEGIIVKDLDSPWEPGDRSLRWLKLKPDYLHTSSDLDLLVIGGYYGAGRRGGKVSQFLLAIVDEAPPPDQQPTKFSTMCRAGGGMTDEEIKGLCSHLEPHFLPYARRSPPPNGYKATNHPKERPDVWVYPPSKSVILQIRGDFRMMHSEVFCAPYSLRFPRVQAIRYDKPWYNCLTKQELLDMVSSAGPVASLMGPGNGNGNGAAQGEAGEEAGVQGESQAGGAAGEKHPAAGGEEEEEEHKDRRRRRMRKWNGAPGPSGNSRKKTKKTLDVPEYLKLQAEPPRAGSTPNTSSPHQQESDSGNSIQRPLTQGEGSGVSQSATVPPPEHGNAFEDCTFYFVNLPASTSMSQVMADVSRLSGTVSANLTTHVTYTVADSPKGWKYQAACRAGDVLSFAWFRSCVQAGALLPPSKEQFFHVHVPPEQSAPKGHSRRTRGPPLVAPGSAVAVRRGGAAPVLLEQGASGLTQRDPSQGPTEADRQRRAHAVPQEEAPRSQDSDVESGVAAEVEEEEEEDGGSYRTGSGTESAELSEVSSPTAMYGRTLGGSGTRGAGAAGVSGGDREAAEDEGDAPWAEVRGEGTRQSGAGVGQGQWQHGGLEPRASGSEGDGTGFEAILANARGEEQGACRPPPCIEAPKEKELKGVASPGGGPMGRQDQDDATDGADAFLDLFLQ